MPGPSSCGRADQHAERVAPVVAAGVGVHARRAAEFAHGDDQRLSYRPRSIRSSIRAAIAIERRNEQLGAFPVLYWRGEP